MRLKINAPVVQWIERGTSNPQIGVRFLSGAQPFGVNRLTGDIIKKYGAYGVMVSTGACGAPSTGSNPVRHPLLNLERKKSVKPLCHLGFSQVVTYHLSPSPQELFFVSKPAV